MTINRQIARAMAEQLDRVNERDDERTPRPMPPEAHQLRPVTVEAPSRYGNVPPRADDARKIAALEATIKAQAEKIIALRRQVEELREQLALREDAKTDSSVIWLGSRPAITPREAARRVGRSVAQVNRYCNSGHWDATQDATNHWLIYVDKPLNVPTRRGKQK